MADQITPQQLHEAHRWFQLDELSHLPGNPNRGDDPSLHASLDEFGWIDGVVVHAGVVIAGNHRVDQARARGETGLPGYDLTDLGGIDDARRMAMALAHNHTSRQGSNDPQLLRSDGQVDAPDNVPEQDQTPAVTKTGDRWRLGPHIVVCGDSTEAGCYPSAADAMVTDPPYGISYGELVDFRASIGKHYRAEDDKHIANDATDEAIRLWEAAFPLAMGALADRSAWYCWSPPGAQQVDLGQALVRAGGKISGSVIWVKSMFSFSRSDHKYQHEPAWYGWLADGSHVWHGETNEPSVWMYDQPYRSELHPTQKPVDLIARCVRNITRPVPGRPSSPATNLAERPT